MELYFESYAFSNFRDFSTLFLNFFKLILDLCGFLKINLSHTDVVDVCVRHVATYVHVMRQRIRAHVHARVETCVRVSVIRGLSILFRIYSNPLNTPFIYRSDHLYFCDVGQYFFIFMQVTWRDRKLLIRPFNQSCKSSLKGEGYAATSNWALIHFKMI